MSIANDMLKAGFDAFLQTHGETFVCEGNSFMGHARLMDGEPLEYVNNTTPSARAEIWIPANVRSLSDPFRTGMYITSGRTQYEVISVTPPTGTCYWQLIASVDYLSEEVVE